MKYEDINDKCGLKTSLKLENLQITGSFKLRGATNKILSLPESERVRGVITVSSGNHGLAVSYAASKLGLRAVICMSEKVPSNKVQAIQKLGAEIVIMGATYDEAEIHANHLKVQEGLTMVHPFDDLDIIAGQGTIGLELLEDCPEIDSVIIPLSGGGLLTGIALALKYTKPEIYIIGVTMDRGAAMVESLKAGKVVDIIEKPTLADALVGGIGLDNRYTFRLTQELVHETVLVSEEEIAHSMLYAFRKQNLIVEGGGAVGLAALLNRKVSNLGKNIVVVISGGNVQIPLINRLFQEN
jgi:threonine dehydratase